MVFGDKLVGVLLTANLGQPSHIAQVYFDYACIKLARDGVVKYSMTRQPIFAP